MAKIKDYNFPDDLYYHREHAWVRFEEDGTATVGITDFAQQMAGEIVYMDMPFPDDEVQLGETAAKIQSAKWIGKLISPVTGTVTETSEDVEGEATLINEDPYGQGWIFKVQPADAEADKKQLLHDTGEIEQWLDAEIVRIEKEKAEGEARKAEKDKERGIE